MKIASVHLCLQPSLISDCLTCSSSQRERYVVTYNPTKGNIYALLKDQAKPDDILKATFHVSNLTFLCSPNLKLSIYVDKAKFACVQANVLLHIIRSSNGNRSFRKYSEIDPSVLLPSSTNLEAHIADSYKMVSALFGLFKSKAKEQVR